MTVWTAATEFVAVEERQQQRKAGKGCAVEILRENALAFARTALMFNATFDSLSRVVSPHRRSLVIKPGAHR